MSWATHEAVYEARHPLDLVADDPVDGGPDVPPGVVGPIAPTPAPVTRAVTVSCVAVDCAQDENGADDQTSDSHAF